MAGRGFEINTGRWDANRQYAIADSGSCLSCSRPGTVVHGGIVVPEHPRYQMTPTNTSPRLYTYIGEPKIIVARPPSRMAKRLKTYSSHLMVACPIDALSILRYSMLN